MMCIAMLAGVGLGTASTADAQKVCRHIGKWMLVESRYVCRGDHADGHCVWTDDCRMNVE